MAECAERKNEEAEEDPPSFEKVLDELGMGRFQMIQLSLAMSTIFICSFMIMTFVFHGHAPYHECRKVNETELMVTYGLQNDSTAHVSYESCDIEISTNQSGEVTQVDSLSCPNGRDFFDAKHTTYVSEWDLVCESTGRTEFSHTTFTIGQIIGGLIASFLADRFGRKPLIMLSSSLCCLIEIAHTFAPSIYAIYIIKFFGGVCYQASVNCVFTLVIELSAPRHRQVVGIVFNSLWIIYVLVLGIIGWAFRDYSWRYVQGAGVISGLVCLLHPFILKESPRWLAANHRNDEALRILKHASKQNGKDFEKVKEIFYEFISYVFPTPKDEHLVNGKDTDSQNQQVNMPAVTISSQIRSPFRMLLNKRILVLIVIGWYIWLTNILTYFGLFITSSELAGDRFLNFILMDLVEFPSLALTMFMLFKMGRRLVLGSSMALAALALTISALLTTFGEGLEGTDMSVTVFFILGKFAITASFGVVYIITPELFPTNIRSTAAGICNSMGRIGSSFAPYLRPFHSEVKWGPALVLTCMCILSVILIWFLPETKDKDLPNTVDEMMEQRNSKKKKRQEMKKGKDKTLMNHEG